MSYIRNSSLKKLRFPSEASYGEVFSKGKRLKFGILSLKTLYAPDFHTRFCFIAKKKNGCAVFRNRCRRILRPIFFNAAGKFKKRMWIMVTINMNAENADWKELRACGHRVVAAFTEGLAAKDAPNS